MVVCSNCKKEMRRLRAGGWRCPHCGNEWGVPSPTDTDRYGEPLCFEEG